MKKDEKCTYIFLMKAVTSVHKPPGESLTSVIQQQLTSRIFIKRKHFCFILKLFLASNEWLKFGEKSISQTVKACNGCNIFRFTRQRKPNKCKYMKIRTINRNMFKHPKDNNKTIDMRQNYFCTNIKPASVCSRKQNPQACFPTKYPSINSRWNHTGAKIVFTFAILWAQEQSAV